MPAALRLAERLRGDARPGRRVVQVRAARRGGAGRAPLRARHQRARDVVDVRYGMGRRHRGADARGTSEDDAGRPGARAAHPRARAGAGPDRAVRRGRGRARARLRPALRVRRHAGDVVARGAREPRDRARGRRRPARAPDLRRRARARRRRRRRDAHAARGRGLLLRPRLGRPGAQRPRVARRRLGAGRGDGRVLARMAGRRALPRPPLARPPAALGADAQGADLRANRRHGGGADDVVAGDPGRRAQLGLPLHVDPRRDLHAVGDAHARLRPRGALVRRLRARRAASSTTRRFRSCTGSRASAS